MDTWEECHAAGMTAIDAAKAMGKSHVAAHKWSKRTGLAWNRLSPAEHAERVRRGMGKLRPIQCNSLGAKRDDSRAMPPAQQRNGGRFWMVNNKTGERVQKASSGGIYLHAMLMGWTDWDWGQGE